MQLQIEQKNPSKEEVIKYNQKLSQIQNDIFNVLHDSWKEYEPIQDILENLIDVISSYQEL